MSAYQRLPSTSFTPVPDPVDSSTQEDTRPLASYDLAWMDGKGHATWDSRMLPDTPEIEGAVCCLARGAMLRGANGPVAIEDLMPGDRVATATGGTVRIDWIGSRTYRGEGARPHFYRVSAQAFGANGPDQDVILGAHAQIMVQSMQCLSLVGARDAFAPISAFEDGMNVIAITPPGETSVYGIACAGQEAVLVAGLPVETYHPSRTTTRSLNRVVLSDMARLFPHVAGGAGFGAPRVPYLSLSEAQGLALTGA